MASSSKNTNPLERDVLKAITSYLKTLDIGVVIRNNTGSFSTGSRFIKCGIKGTSDLSVELYGSTKTVWIEVKRIGGKPTPEQLDFLERQTKRGNPAFISHSVEELATQLKSCGVIK